MKPAKLTLIGHAVVLAIIFSLTGPQIVMARGGGKGSSGGVSGRSVSSGQGRHRGWEDTTSKTSQYHKQKRVRQQEHAQGMTALRNKHKEEMKAMHNKHKKEMKAMRNKYKEETKNLQNKEEKRAKRNQYQEEARNRKRLYQQETAAKRNQCQEEIRQRQREYAGESEDDITNWDKEE